MMTAVMIFPASWASTPPASPFTSWPGTLAGLNETTSDSNLPFNVEHGLSRFLIGDGNSLYGSDVTHLPEAECEVPQLQQLVYAKSNLIDDNQDLIFYQRHATTTLPPGIHVVEIFGGEGRTTCVLVRRFGVRPGLNFDLVAHGDLLSPEHERAFWDSGSTSPRLWSWLLLVVDSDLGVV